MQEVKVIKNFPVGHALLYISLNYGIDCAENEFVLW